MESLMTASQVCAARRRVARGASVKEVALEMSLSYQVVYNAVTGKTWSMISEPPPLFGELRKRRRKNPLRICGNCGRRYDRRRGGDAHRCCACVAYWYRHGEERPAQLCRDHIRLSDCQVRRLYEQYLSGESLADIAAPLPFSEETLRRRFAAAGLPLRSRTGMRRQLTAALVLQARQQVNIDGEQIKELSRRWGVNYMTLYAAVTGKTWRTAGGPLPAGKEMDEKRPCLRCDLLTAHATQVCRYCRSNA